MIKDGNEKAIQAVGAKAVPPHGFFATVGVPNSIPLNRASVYRVLARFDVYFMQGNVDDAGAFDPPDDCEYLPGGQFVTLSTENFDRLYVEGVNTNGHVYVSEVQ